MADAPEYTTVSPPELQTNMLLDNLSKLERNVNSIILVTIVAKLFFFKFIF